MITKRTDLYYHDEKGGHWKWPAIIEQGEVWIDVNGVEHQITEMDESYKKNVIRFMIENHRRLLSLMHFREILLFSELLDSPLGPQGEMAQYYAESEFDELCSMSAEEWFKTTPLYKSLSS